MPQLPIRYAAASSLRPNSYVLTRVAVFAGLFLSSFGCAFGADKACGFLPIGEIESAFPQYQPWHVTNGGDGACAFEGELSEDDVIHSVILKFTQQLQADGAQSQEVFGNIESEFAKHHTLTPFTDLGSKAFGYSAIDNKDWTIWAFEDRALFSALLIGPRITDLTSAEKGALKNLTMLALKNANTPAARAKASKCAYFDEALLAALLPGKPANVQQFGENSCMAQSEKQDIVMASVVEASEMLIENLKASESVDCTVEPLGDGVDGFLSHSCKSGNPHVSVKFDKAGMLFELSFIPNGRAPNQQDQQKLKALALWNAKR